MHPAAGEDQEVTALQRRVGWPHAIWREPLAQEPQALFSASIGEVGSRALPKTPVMIHSDTVTSDHAMTHMDPS